MALRMLVLWFFGGMLVLWGQETPFYHTCAAGEAIVVWVHRK